MKININSKLIEEFRNEVNESHFFYYQYSNNNGNNDWNLMCSAMDWITIASEGLPHIEIDSKGFGYNHLETLNLMQYLITVDVMVESIKKLYSVLNSGKSYPFKSNKEVFKHEELSDDRYFKHLRAVFSTHPVDLHSLDGVYTKGEKFYASWVSKSVDSDFSASLYSSKPDKDELQFIEINIKDINLYAEKRYNLLIGLIDKLKEIKDNHRKKYKDKKIKVVKNPREQLKILLNENKDRFGEMDAYSYFINYLYSLLSVDVKNIDFEDYDKKVIYNYLSYLKTFIPKILEHLQNLKLANLTINLKWSEYEFEKIYMYLSNGEHTLGKMYFINFCKMVSFPHIVEISNDLILKRLFFDSYLYYIGNLKDRPISYKDIENNQKIKGGLNEQEKTNL